MPKPSLRVLLAAAFGAVSLTAAVVASLLAGAEAARDIERRILLTVGTEASQVAERLDREMSGRFRDLRIAAGLPLMQRSDTPPEIRRMILSQLQDSLGAGALVAFVTPDGRIAVDGRQLLEGRDVSGSPVLRSGLQAPSVQDAGEAFGARGAASPQDPVPLRAVDLAAPVRDEGGRVIGVVAAHLDPHWVAQALGQPAPGEPERILLSREGTLLFGPPGLGRAGDAPPVPKGGAGRLEFPDGTWLAALAPTGRRATDPGLGWQVLARLPAAEALRPVHRLQRGILASGIGAALAAALLGWFAAAWLAEPLRRLSAAAARLRVDPDAPPLPREAGYAEAATLGATLDGLLGDRRRTEAALRESEARLRLAQQAGQIGTYEWDVLTDTTRFTAEYARLLGLAAPEGEEAAWREGYAAWMARVAEEDRARVAEAAAAALARPGPYAFEYRIRIPGEAHPRWLADQGEVLADGAGNARRAVGVVRDVTARRLAEQALRASEERLRLAQEAAGIGTWELDLASGRQVWSPRQFALFGLDPQGEPPDLDAWLALLHPEDRAPLRAIATDPGSAGADFAVEFRIRRAADGAQRWIAARGRVQAGPDGRPERMLGINIDMTESRAREAALAERGAELRAMLEANPIGVIRGDVHGRILDANAAMLRLIGRDRAELEAGALRWDTITPPEWLPRDAAAIEEARREGVCTPYEKEYVLHDGRRVPVLVGFTLTGENRTDTVAFILDLTDRKRADDALRQANAALERRVEERTATLAAREAELRRIYDRTPAPFHSVDAEGRLIRVSAEWLRFLGYEEHEVLGLRTCDFMTPESAARWEAALEELRRTGEETREVEYVMRRRDGRELDVLLRARAEHGPDGGFLRSYSVLFDVTARNRAEARLREAQKLEALGRIAGGVAHDFNNMLQVITGALRLAETHAERPERVRRYVGAAQEAALRGAGITRRMLAFARQDQLRQDAVPLDDVLGGLRALLRTSLGPAIAIALEAPADLPPIVADRVQLELALFNLALNARDAMPGGGTLQIAAAARSLGTGEEPGLPPGRYVRVRVADTGHGMDAETLSRAAEPFFTTKEVGQGSGLGLSMVHGFAAQSGGALVIESRPGRGTVVDLWLPAAAVA